MTTTESSQQEKINLLDLDAEGIRAWCASIGQKPFRATQLARWIHRYCCDDFDAMTNLAKEFRARLKDLAYIKAPSIIREHKSADGTRKWLFDVGNGNAVEAVFIPEDDRGTLCISTQAAAPWGAFSALRVSRALTATSRPVKLWGSFGPLSGN